MLLLRNMWRDVLAQIVPNDDSQFLPASFGPSSVSGLILRAGFPVLVEQGIGLQAAVFCGQIELEGGLTCGITGKFPVFSLLCRNQAQRPVRHGLPAPPSKPLKLLNFARGAGFQSGPELLLVTTC